ncbi:MAG: DEAD/DEAH box helicase family protein [Planctomycetota bacterium]
MTTGRQKPSDAKGQWRVIQEVRRLVDEWRGFELGRAADPYPVEAPRYEPRADGERQLTETTRSLLMHWFRQEPHLLGRSPTTIAFKYWPHQRRLVESFVYLYEVRGIRRTEQLYALAGADPLGPQHDPWSKLGGQLATGSGKTKMMGLLIAWAYLNAVREPQSGLGFGRHSVLIAPGLFVRDRLLQDFAPPTGKPSVFFADPVIPPEFESDWNLKVYSPATCPRSLDPDEGALVVTNYHQLLRSAGDVELPESQHQRQLELLFEAGDPQRLEAVESPLIDRFARSRGLLILNDEAHHVWDETGHAKFEQKAKEKAKVAGAEDAETEMAWIRCIRRLNGSEQQEGRVALQADLSATLFEEQGTKQKGGKTEFRQPDLFRHTAVHYGLAEAIKDGIVKKPILEKVVAKNKKTGEPLPLVNDAGINAWEKYTHLLTTGIERWKKVRDQLADEGDPRKPILFLLCNDRKEAREVANFLAYGKAVPEDLSNLEPTGYLDHLTKTPLFVEKGPDGRRRSTVVEIHIGQKEESNEAEWEKVRASVNAIDSDEMPDPEGKQDEAGRPIMLPNPFNVVVSVMMLKEGWDVRNVKVIVPLRPCDSRTLTEQTLGRGLRKMHAPELDDEGGAEMRSEELFVIEHPSFEKVLAQIQDIIEEKASDEIEHSRDYVAIQQKSDEAERSSADVRLARFEGLIQVQHDWRKNFDSAKVAPLVPKMSWLEEISETEIRTFLKRALEKDEEQGQSFDMPANPSYRDFDHVLEVAYALPMLREMRASYQHKTAVKEIVREFLERKTFALPAGIPLSFAAVSETGEGAKIALGNLARPEVVDRVRKALLAPLHAALSAERPSAEAIISERKASELSNYQALRKHLLDATRKSSFATAAVENADELRVAALLDNAPDVAGWIYNHRSGVGYFIEYAWQGRTARYFPDFIVRVKFGVVWHNVIIEVKGRLDDRDKTKARRGEHWCEMLSDYDREPWHYLLLIENQALGRSDIGWWERRSSHEIGFVLKRHEALPLVPDDGVQAAPAPVVASVPTSERHTKAVPVYDLRVAAGGFSSSQAPEPIGWMRAASPRPIDERMFVAQVVGKSMEDGVPDGSLVLFRFLPAGGPSAVALDGKRILVQLREGADAEGGGCYTLKRWKVAELTEEGRAVAIELQSDNAAFKPVKLTAASGDVRPVAEAVAVVG